MKKVIHRNDGTGRPETLRRTQKDILFVQLGFGMGGSVRSLATVLAHVSGVGRVVATPRQGALERYIHDNALAEKVIRLPQSSRRGRPIAAVMVAYHAWRMRGNLQAIHANGLPELSIVLPAAVLTRLPVVVWAHDSSLSPWSKRLAPIWKVMLPRARYAAVSEVTREVMKPIVRPERCTIVPNPIDPDDVVGRRAPRQDRTHLVCAFLGSAQYDKGFHMLPKVIPLLAGEPVEWEIFAGPREWSVKVWAALEAISDPRVQLNEKSNTVRDVYARIDIVYCPSFKESFGRVVAEAMANGLPIVANDLPAIRELLGNDDAGLLVPVGQPAAAAEALRKLILDPELRSRLGDEGRRRVQSFLPNHVIGTLQSLYGL